MEGRFKRTKETYVIYNYLKIIVILIINMLNRLTQDQFEHILNALILYNQLTPPTTNVYLSEKSIKEAFNFINTQGKDVANQLGIQE